MQSRKLSPQNLGAFMRDAIRLAPVLRWQWLNPALRLKARNCSIERAGAQTRPAKPGNILNHGVPVLRPARQARKHKQRRIGIVPELRAGVYYVTRTTHYVVIAQTGHMRNSTRIYP